MDRKGDVKLRFLRKTKPEINVLKAQSLSKRGSSIKEFLVMNAMDENLMITRKELKNMRHLEVIDCIISDPRIFRIFQQDLHQLKCK